MPIFCVFTDKTGINLQTPSVITPENLKLQKPYCMVKYSIPPLPNQPPETHTVLMLLALLGFFALNKFMSDSDHE